MEQLGGLIHRMPQTAFVFLVGCVAISALPPLNGFVSEWLTFQAILLSPQLPPWGLKFLVPAVGALLALSAALAAACFVQGLRRHLSRPRRARRRPSARARPTASRSPRCSPSPRSACSPASCPASSSTRWRRWCRAWSAAACRCSAASPGSRSCRSPRAAAPTTACSCSCSSLRRGIARRLRDPPARLRRAAPRAALGLRLSRSEPGDAIHRRQLRPADPPRVRHRGVPRARARRDAAARRHAAGAAHGRAARSRSGTGSTRRSPAASASPPTGSTICSS